MSEPETEMIMFRAPKGTLKAIDQFIDDETAKVDSRISRSDALRTIIDDWLMGHGYFPLDEED